MIYIAQPQLGHEELDAIAEVLESGMIAQGQKVKAFEDAFAEYVGADYAVAVGNGTQALHLSLLAQEVGEGDLVVTSPFTFVSTASAILMTGAEIIFVDIKPDTFNIDPMLAQKAFHLFGAKAIVPVHLYGHPADMWGITDVLHFGRIIWDACQAHGAMICDNEGDWFSVGAPFPSHHSSTSCWSFYATKNMTTGEGGMITTNYAGLADSLRMLRDHGQSGRYSYAHLGYNYRMTDIQAAIGLAQLEKLPKMQERRQEIASHYNRYLGPNDAIITPHVDAGVTHAWHQYTIRVPKGRDDLKKHLENRGVHPKVYYPTPLHKTKLFRDLGYGSYQLPVAEQAAKEVLSLPIHAGLTKDEMFKVVRAVNSWEPQ